MNNAYQKIIERILEDTDLEIREIMLEDTEQVVPIYHIEGDTTPRRNYKAYELLPDPTNTILGWQSLRDRKKQTNE